MKFLILLAGWLATFALNGLFIMLLWNAILPDLFAIKEVGYLQAVGLGLLVSALVRGSEVSVKQAS